MRILDIYIQKEPYCKLVQKISNLICKSELSKTIYLTAKKKNPIVKKTEQFCKKNVLAIFRKYFSESLEYYLYDPDLKFRIKNTSKKLVSSYLKEIK